MCTVKKEERKRYYRKRVDLFRLVGKIKLWTSRKGILHGIQSIEIEGVQAKLTTHCQETFIIRNSLNSRAARWLRNKWFSACCSACRIPEWKIKKYNATLFSRNRGSMLLENRSSESGKPAV